MAFLGNGFYLGNFGEKDYEQAFYWSKKAAEKGNVKGIHTLGCLYLYGCGVAPDPEMGLTLLKKATEMGDMKSPRYLELASMEGLCGEKDPEKAGKWFRMAADRGDVTSQYELGRIYEEGIGVEKDLEREMQSILNIFFMFMERQDMSTRSGIIQIVYKKKKFLLLARFLLKFILQQEVQNEHIR